jgi:hypothetical protein
MYDTILGYFGSTNDRRIAVDIATGNGTVQFHHVVLLSSHVAELQARSPSSWQNLSKL